MISDPESVSGQLHTEIDVDDLKKEEANRRECQIKEAEPDLYARTLETPAEVSCSPPYQQMTITKKSHPRIDSQEDTINVNVVITNNDVYSDLEQVESDQIMDRDNMSAIPEGLARIHFLVLEVGILRSCRLFPIKVCLHKCKEIKELTLCRLLTWQIQAVPTGHT